MPNVSFDRLFSGSLVTAGGLGMASMLLPVFFTAPNLEATQERPAVQATQQQAATALPKSVPVRLEIPDIGLTTELSQVGKNADGSLEVPADANIAGWYRLSPTPGEIGPSIITGHVDTYTGPAVFFYLKDLVPGQTITITRKDKTKAHFRVDKVASFEQQAFPTKEVYGDIDYPGLRLITCGGVYDVLSGHYSHNTVVYATLVDS